MWSKIRPIGQKNKIVNYFHLCHKCCKNVDSLRLCSDEITSKVSSKLYQRYITKTVFSAIKENLPTLCLNVFVKFIINAVNKCIDCTQCFCIPSKSLDKDDINALISHLDDNNEILQCEKSCLKMYRGKSYLPLLSSVGINTSWQGFLQQHTAANVPH